MRTAIIAMLIIASLQGNYSNAMQNENNGSHHSQSASISPKEFIVAGILAGGTIEFVNYVRKDERYKYFAQFGKKYPGFFIAGFSAIIGTGFLYGQPLKSFIQLLWKRSA